MRTLRAAALLRLLADHRQMEPKPMTQEGLQPTYRFGAKPSTYAPSPSGPPRSGKRRRQWR